MSDALSGRLTRYVYDLSGRLAEKREYTKHTLLATRLVSSVRYTYSETTGQPIAAAYTSPLGNVSMSYTYGSGYSGEMQDVIYAVKRGSTTDVAYTYDSLGRRQSRSLAAGAVTQQYTYIDDPDAPALTSTRVATATDHNGPTEYTYDANGNIIHTQNYSAAQDFTYDALGQLTSYRNIYRDTYAYTYQNGNILTATKNGETYHTYGYTNAGWSDLLTSFDGGTITYDAIGNPLTYHDGKTFTWTAGRKLSTVTDGDSNYTYAYDGDGNRISKTVDGVTTDYYYIDGKLLGLKKGQDTLLFLYDETGTAYGFLHNGTLYYYDINLQGDVVGIYNGSGNLVASYTYDVWGAPELTSDNAIATLNPLRYRGYFYDEETGFYYLQSRYYNPEVGRFINADGYVQTPNGDMTSTNMFVYCGNDPVNYHDPSGEFFAVALLGATIGGIAAWKIGVAIVGACAAFFVADSVVKNLPDAPPISLPKIEIKPRVEAKPKSEAKPKAKDVAPSLPKPPAKDPVHHIVAKADPRAEESRQILRNVGIEPVTDPRNLVVLPQSYHASLHTTAYHNYVTEQLRPVAGNKAGVEATLASLKAEIRARSAAGIRWD